MAERKYALLFLRRPQSRMFAPDAATEIDNDPDLG